MVSSEPVSEALLPVYNQLQTLRKCLLDVKQMGGVSSPRELYPYSMKVCTPSIHTSHTSTNLPRSSIQSTTWNVMENSWSVVRYPKVKLVSLICWTSASSWITNFVLRLRRLKISNPWMVSRRATNSETYSRNRGSDRVTFVVHVVVCVGVRSFLRVSTWFGVLHCWVTAHGWDSRNPALAVPFRVESIFILWEQRAHHALVSIQYANHSLYSVPML